MADRVFISHSSRDRHIASAICSFLERTGIRCWVAPRDLRPGRPYGSEILTGIDDSAVMLVVLSSQANTSQHVYREVERAISRGITVIPVRIEDIVPSRDLEYFLSAGHWLDAITPPIEQHLERIRHSIEVYLAAVQVPASETHEQRRHAEHIFQDLAPDEWGASSSQGGFIGWLRDLLRDK